MRRPLITPVEIALAGIGLILIGVSFYQTWQGLEQIFQKASVFVAFALSVLLIIICWMIRNARLHGQRVRSFMAIYFFIASFCFMANFNALYTNFMRTDIYGTEIRNINDSFNNLERDVEAKLNYKYPKETAQNVETKKKQLMAQIQDKGNPGIGDKASSLIRDMEKMLGDKIDILVPVNKDYEDLATRMGKQIDGMLSNLSPTESELKNDINKAVLKWNKKIQDVLLLSKEEKDDISQGLIDESLTEYNKLGNRAQTVLGVDKLKFENQLSKTQDIGKIGYAFEHAFRNFGIYQIIVLMGCALLDFFLPIIIILMTNKEMQLPAEGNVRAGMRRGKIITPNN